jgi:hypothetical protein
MRERTFGAGVGFVEILENRGYAVGSEWGA